MPKSKFQIGLEAEVAAIPDEELANLEACPTNSEDFWFRNSENGTRTRIDLILLDTLRQLKIARPAETSKMSAWTEISLSWPSETVELSGRGDYFIGYSSSENAEDALQTLLMAGEAKVLDGEKNLAWEFVWVDNNGVIVNSAVISEISEVQTWLSYIIINARSSTPTAIPKMSLEDLSKFAVKIERFTTATSSSKEELVVDEDELRAFEQEFKRQLALSAKKAAKA
ncbi:hypothetical protein HK097_000616 [Rhizophlyctis rosea]|uniref:Uncharacterized protein n=1 Tax=Rhizophlyctis rosea TaxID=64517 RepID=A0AAD5X4L3_9FUNG|nr:hypothetical protein HK097_000616 [Rhizophlyctis rosea]